MEDQEGVENIWQPGLTQASVRYRSMQSLGSVVFAVFSVLVGLVGILGMSLLLVLSVSILTAADALAGSRAVLQPKPLMLILVVSVMPGVILGTRWNARLEHWYSIRWQGLLQRKELLQRELAERRSECLLSAVGERGQHEQC